MKVKVEMTLLDHPTAEHQQEMRSAAAGLTSEKKSIVVCEHTSQPQTLVAQFTMKTAAQYKVVDEIARQFKNKVRDYADITIGFAK